MELSEQIVVKPRKSHMADWPQAVYGGINMLVNEQRQVALVTRFGKMEGMVYYIL
jgi:hypothetical protein